MPSSRWIKVAVGVALVLTVPSACVIRSCAVPHRTAQGEVGLLFAQALVAGDFKGAHRLLEPGLGTQFTPAKLETTYRDMISYGGGPAREVRVMAVLDYWPARQPSDVGWVYVAISGDSFSEAVTVTVTEVGGLKLIREIEWGRP